MTSSALLLLLLDSRSPAGAHNHSGGMEPAIATGLVGDLADVETFCRGRLRTAGRIAADFAAAACDLHDQGGVDAHRWALLDVELDARTPSPALRAASRQLGNGLRRMVRAMLPDFDPRWPASLPAPHHPLVLGAAVSAAGGTPEIAARAAALGTVSGPASAAVRLIGLDPFGVQAMLARLAADIDREAIRSVRALDASGAPALAADSAPALELLADFHLTTEVRLFAS